MACTARCAVSSSSRAVIPPGRAGAATVRVQRTPARRSLAVLAAGSGGKKSRPARGRRARGAPRPKEERQNVTFRAPGEETCFESLKQAELEAFLQVMGAKGFRTASGKVSRSLEHLFDGGDVDLVLPQEIPVAQQVRPWLACQPAGRRAGLPGSC